MPTIWWPFPSRPKSPTFVQTGCPYFKQFSHLRGRTEIGHGLSVGMCKCTDCWLWILASICKVLLFQFVWNRRQVYLVDVCLNVPWMIFEVHEPLTVLQCPTAAQWCEWALFPRSFCKNYMCSKMHQLLTRLTRFRFCHKSTFALLLEVKDESTMESVLDEFSTTSWVTAVHTMTALVLRGAVLVMIHHSGAKWWLLNFSSSLQ